MFGSHKYPDSHEVDSLLQRLVDLAEHFQFSIGITVYLNGCVIAGTLISHSEYIKRTSKEVKTWNIMATNEDPKAIREGLLKHLEQLTEMREYLRTEPGEGASELRSTYLHLADFTVFNGGILYGDSLAPVRIKVSSVDGWTFGTYIKRRV